MDQVNVFIVLGAALLGGMTPGPGTLAIAGTAMARGRAMGLATAWGITSASIVWSVAAALGFGALLQANSNLFDAMRYLGVAYLMWLGWKSAKAAIGTRDLTPTDIGTDQLIVAWMKGLSVHLTNPKAVIYWGSIFAISIQPGGGAVAIAWVIALSLMVNVVLVTSYAILFSSAPLMAGYLRARRWIEGAAALFFGTAAVFLLRSRDA